MKYIGFGGGCHWCTEAVFQSIKGVDTVYQGWIGSIGDEREWSEAVLVRYNPDRVSLATLIEAHLLTHSSESNHSFRHKYRSAVYTMSTDENEQSSGIIKSLAAKTNTDYICQALPFRKFKSNVNVFLNYYQTRKDAPFCTRYIEPKLRITQQL
ncbi:peptide-methionine (S)-S-oxide reductase [Echinicola pacifica]|nr:peptide-methionine (S)-S-oxide reductase [Echinicola pacifica]